MEESPLPAQIGARLRRLRTASGRSLASVAQQLGISSSALSQIETGTMRPSVNRLVELVAVLGAGALALGLGNFERMRAHDAHLLAAQLSPRRAA